ncbi:MAG: hypothetical protein H6623_00780 [Bdellovibrionaceae bacterium]|nr:hypothetical protein [Pseudobdellovibrionaceae bacterium]
MSMYVPTPKRPRRSIKLDRVNPADFNKMSMVYSCEQCSHYDPEKDVCTIGYWPELHKQKAQLQRFYTHSHMAFCRFMEID